MTVGLMGSSLLCECIEEILASSGGSREEQRVALDTLPASFHIKLGALVDYPWAVSTGPDAAYVSAGSAEVSVAGCFLPMCVYCDNVSCKKTRKVVTAGCHSGSLSTPQTQLGVKGGLHACIKT